MVKERRLEMLDGDARTGAWDDLRT